MGSRNMKIGFRNLLLVVVIVLAAATPQARTSDAPNIDEGANIEKFAVKRVQPAYPPNAQKYKIEGVVEIRVSVGNDGRVTTAEFVRGHNIFRSVSLDAAKRWEFRLAGENNLAGMIHFTFKLNE